MAFGIGELWPGEKEIGGVQISWPKSLEKLFGLGWVERCGSEDLPETLRVHGLV